MLLNQQNLEAVYRLLSDQGVVWHLESGLVSQLAYWISDHSKPQMYMWLNQRNLVGSASLTM